MFSAMQLIETIMVPAIANHGFTQNMVGILHECTYQKRKACMDHWTQNQLFCPTVSAMGTQGL